jgi:Putative zinc-finger
MTCAECREAFSALADEALGAAERVALEQHLAGCADCRREWQRFSAAVGLLRAVQPARAPAGFVDRVLAAARPQPWYRRALRELLVPWSVKLPLEAAAVVLVAGLAILIFQRSPELQQAAAPPASAPGGRFYELSRGAEPSNDQSRPRAEAPVPAPTAGSTARMEDRARADETPAAQATSATTNVATGESRPEATPDTGRRELAAQDVRQQAQAPPSVKAPSPTAKPAPPVVAGTIPKRARLGLKVADRMAAARDVTEIVTRLGGTMQPRRDGGALDATLPRAAWPMLAGELARLGTVTVLAPPPDPAEVVPVTITLTE